MTRLKYYLPAGLLILAVMIALAAGFGLAELGDFSTRTVGRLFAVPYRVELRGESAQAAAFPEVVSARVSNDTVMISSASGEAPVVLDLSQTVLTAADPAMLRENRLRSGMMTLLLFCLALLCSAALAASAVSMIEANRRAAARKHAAKRAVPRREAAASRKPLPPSGPQRLPRAA